MAMVVKNNMSAVRTLNTLNNNSNALQGSLAKVSSGMKINSAQDDASGYAISERMRVQIRSLDQANQNTQNGSSLMKTAEGAVSKTVEILKSLKEKAISAATDTNTDSDRVTIQKEIDQFIDQIDDNALVTFNGKYLVDGSKTQAGDATYTAMTNQSMATDTAGGTAMTDLKNRNNESLEISSTDFVTASFVKDGKTFTTKYQVGKTTLEDVFTNLNAVATDASIGEVFGSAHLSDPSAVDTDAAKTILSSASAADLFKAVTNPADTTQAAAAADSGGTKVKISELAQAITDLGDKAYAVIDSNYASFGDAQNALSNELKTALEGVAVKVVNGSSSNAATDVSVPLKDGDGDALTTVAEVDTVAADGSSTATVTTANTADLTALLGKISTAADAYAADNTEDSIGTVVNALTTLTAGTPTATGSTNLTPTITTNATIAANNATVEKYEKAYAVSKVLAAAGGDGLVSKGSDVGLAASGDMVSTANGENGVTVTAKTEGLKGQISGLAISITDSQGNVKKSANASLDAFSTTIFAANKSDDNALKFHVGATANLSITVGLADMRSEALGLKGSDGSKVSVATQSKANAAVATFDNALQKALDIQTTIGAVEARLDYTSSNLTTSSENVQAAESTIRDADMAKEMTNYTKNNVLLQAAQSMLAQANQNSSAVLSLLQ